MGQTMIIQPMIFSSAAAVSYICAQCTLLDNANDTEAKINGAGFGRGDPEAQAGNRIH